MDGSNTQEIVDTSDGGAVWYAVPVMLWPAKGDLVFLFAYVYRLKQPLTNWCLVNSCGQDVIVLIIANNNFCNPSKDAPQGNSIGYIQWGISTAIALARYISIQTV